MALPKTLAFNKGMTLAEILIVIGILLLLGTLGLFISIQTYQGYAFRSDKDILISALQRARSQSVFNICLGTSTTCTGGRPHGVKIDTLNKKIIIFQGLSYDLGPGRDANDQAQDFAINTNPNITYSGLNEVVFTQLSGDATAGQITLTDTTNNQEDRVNINSEGQISWEN